MLKGGKILPHKYNLLTERETMVFFVNNLYTSYYKKLVGNAIKIFTNMVISDEMIKNVMKNDNINAKENK